MDISVEYSDEEIDAILLAHHQARFGEAPKGEQWALDELAPYGRRRVKNQPIPQPKPVEEPPAAEEVVEAEPSGTGPSIPPPAHPGWSADTAAMSTPTMMAADGRGG